MIANKSSDEAVCRQADANTGFIGQCKNDLQIVFIRWWLFLLLLCYTIVYITYCTTDRAESLVMKKWANAKVQIHSNVCKRLVPNDKDIPLEPPLNANLCSGTTSLQLGTKTEGFLHENSQLRLFTSYFKGSCISISNMATTNWWQDWDQGLSPFRRGWQRLLAKVESPQGLSPMQLQVTSKEGDYSLYKAGLAVCDFCDA